MIFKISTQPQDTQIDIGLYKVYILGGFDVQLSPNALEVINVDSGKAMLLETKFMKIRDYKYGQRAVHYYDLMVESSGNYKIYTRYPQAFQVRRTMDFILHFFEGFVPTGQLGILIEKVTL